MDETEQFRRAEVAQINSQVQSNDKDSERARLTAQYGQVYDTNEATTKFEFLSFLAPYAIVKERATGKKGSLEFQHMPRFYFNFSED